MDMFESMAMLRYAMVLYPSMKLSEEQLRQHATVWANEFSNDSPAMVGKAFAMARIESPVWMPSIPSIQAAIRTIRDLAKQEASMKSPQEIAENEFRDSHCGKSQEEWNAMKEWQRSPDGIRKVRQYKQKLYEILGI